MNAYVVFLDCSAATYDKKLMLILMEFLGAHEKLPRLQRHDI